MHLNGRAPSRSGMLTLHGHALPMFAMNRSVHATLYSQQSKPMNQELAEACDRSQMYDGEHGLEGYLLSWSRGFPKYRSRDTHVTFLATRAERITPSPPLRISVYRQLPYDSFCLVSMFLTGVTL